MNQRHPKSQALNFALAYRLEDWLKTMRIQQLKDHLHLAQRSDNKSVGCVV